MWGAWAGDCLKCPAFSQGGGLPAENIYALTIWVVIPPITNANLDSPNFAILTPPSFARLCPLPKCAHVPEFHHTFQRFNVVKLALEFALALHSILSWAKFLGSLLSVCFRVQNFIFYCNFFQ